MLGYNTFYFKLVALMVASMTAALAGLFHTIHQPIVSPNVAGLGWTVAALLMILMGGVGTLSGAMLGAAVFRLLEFYLDRWFGEAASFLLGLIYVPGAVPALWHRRHLAQQSAADQKRTGAFKSNIQIKQRLSWPESTSPHLPFAISRCAPPKI